MEQIEMLQIPAPSEKQRLFLADRHRHVAYGGARGGGKSWAVRVKALLLCCSWPGIKILIVRKSYRELMNNHINPLRAMIPVAMARYNKTRYFSLETAAASILDTAPATATWINTRAPNTM